MDEIVTERLRLRRATMGDLDAIHAIFSDPQAMRYWSTLPHESLAQSEEWLRSMVEADLAESDDFIIERDGQAVGKLGCWQLPDIGYIVAPDQWGQGVASEAMAAFLDRRRAIGKPSRLLADVDPRNVASIKLLERHGFVETHRAKGTWQVGHELCDSVYLALDL
jgi:RimJ/RimL family protein N-acetyltransferase